MILGGDVPASDLCSLGRVFSSDSASMNRVRKETLVSSILGWKLRGDAICFQFPEKLCRVGYRPTGPIQQRCTDQGLAASWISWDKATSGSGEGQGEGRVQSDLTRELSQ